MRTPAPKKPPFKKRPLSIAVRAACYSMLGALPLAQATTGGQVVGGSGTISQSGTNTTINQATQNLAINWQTFNVAANERVQFIQPNATSIALNRVLSNNGSTIAGRIDANGKVILVNPNGVFFTSTASLNVGSLIASGLDINPADFMNGQYIFNEIGGTSGKVVNSGLINASLGGNVALIGKQVKNDGVITANLGTVTLAAGKQAVLTFDNAGLLGVRVSQEILQSELGVDPAVINSGDIQAQGGRVLLTASQSQDVFSRAVNTAGMEPATSVVVHDDGTFTLGGGADVLNSGSINTSTTSAGQTAGRIVLIGENVTSSGTLKADAQNGNGGEIELHARDTTLLTQNSVTSARSETHGQGGIVKVLGDKVGLFDQSMVDVSGANGGGQALIGGDFQGKNSKIRNANVTIVNPYTNIFSDALQYGDGGKVILWADGITYFAGKVFVRGGAVAGNGGFVEISGKENLAFRGSTDSSAANGNAGVLLLDPRDITVVASASSADDSALRTIDFGDCTDSGCSSATDDFTISNTAIQNQLNNNGQVILQANNDIFFNGAVTSTSSDDLTLQAGRSIEINANISLRGGDFRATINDSGALVGRGTGDATFTMASGTGITTNGGLISITTGGFTGNLIGDITLQTLNSNGRAVTAGNDGNLAGSIIVNNSVGDIIANGQISANGSNGAGTNQDGGHANTITLTANRNIEVNAGITATGGNAAGTGNRGNGGAITTTTSGILTVAANINSLRGTIGAGGTSGAIIFNGNISDNIFNINNGVTLTGSSVTVNGLGGNDRLVAGGTTGSSNTWTITVSNTGTLDNGPSLIAFNSVESLIGGSLDDTFILNNALSGLVDGGGGVSDVLTINTTGTNVQLGSRTDSQAVADGRLNVVGVETITANAGSIGTNIILGDNLAMTWVIDGANTGTIAPTVTPSPETTTRYSNFGVLTGGANVDSFAINAAFVGTINGGIGADTFNINSALPATVNGDNGDDVFNIAVGSSLTGTINGGSGSDTFNISANVTGSLNGGDGNDVFNVNTTGLVIASLAGGNDVGTTDTIRGPDAANSWSVTSVGAGTLSGVTFSGMETLTGGSGGDTFTFSFDPTALFSMQVNGGGQGIVGDTVAFNGLSPITVPLARFSDIESITGINDGSAGNGTGNSSTLVGADTVIGWSISGTNSGTYNTTLAFSGFNNLTGGSGADTFTMGLAGAITGVIDGGVVGGNNTLVARLGVVNTWTFTGTESGSLAEGILPNYVNSFARIQTFTGGGVADWANVGGLASVDIGRYVGFTGLVGAGGALNGTGGGDIWTLQVVSNAAGVATDGVDDGTVVFGASTLRFIDFATLNGGAGNDTFIVDATGSITVAINGGGGSNTLIGRNAASSWRVTGPNAGTVGEAALAPALYVANFSGIQNLTGGTGLDTFTYTATGSLTGILDGGTGAAGVLDHVNQSALAVVAVQLGAAGPYRNIEQFTGNGANSTLIGENNANTWTVTGLQTGSVDGVGFSAFAALVGGSNDDTFNFSVRPAAANVTVNGGAHTTSDTVSFAGLTNNQIVSVQLGATGFTNIEQFTGNNTNSTLIGENIVNGWTVTGQNDGTVNGIAFVDFNSLTGGTGADTFTFNLGGSLTGILDGGAGIIDHVNQSALAVVDVTLGAAGPYRNIEQFTGNNTASTLRGDNTANTWTLTGQNDGTVNSIAFVNFNNLTGGTGTDIFNVDTAGQLTGLIDGGAGLGANTLNMSSSTAATLVRLLDAAPAAPVNNPAGTLTVFQIGTLSGNSNANHTLALDVSNPLTASVWNINAVNSGTVNFGPIASFAGFRNLTGSALNDTFILTSGSVQELVTGLINGGGQAVGGEDVLILTGMTGGAAGVAVRLGNTTTAGQLNVHGIERIAGNNTSTLIADNGTNDWRITGANDGTVRLNVGTTDDLVAFSDFSVLRGGDGNDNFQILSPTVTASIAGGGQVVNTPGDTIDYSAQTTVVVNFGPGAFNGITEIESVRGNGTDSTLNGPAAGNASWSVTGINTGSVTDGPATMGFEGFNYLVGGSGNDTFTVTGGSLRNVVSGAPGLIRGGGGTNTLAVALTGTETGQVSYLGTGTDTVTVLAGTTGTYNGAYTPGAAPADYDQLAYTSGTNSVYTVNYRDVDTVQTNRTLATLTVNGSANAETITLGTVTFAVGTRTPVNYTNATNVTVNGQAGTDTINLNSVNLGVGTLTLTAETVTSSGTALTADTLILENVGQFGATGTPISTAITDLRLLNAGPVYIAESNGLNLFTTGTVVNAGSFVVAGITNIDAGGGSLTLDNAANDFDTLNVSNAASVNLRDMDRIDGGTITAASITLNTATGVGTSAAAPLTTSTGNLTINNGAGGVYVNNSGATTARITNLGDIGLTNNGNLTIDRLYSGGSSFLDRGLYRDVTLNVTNGSVQGIPANSIYTAPDITAFDLTVIVQGGGGFGNPGRAMSLSVVDTFSYIGGRGYVHYFGGQRPREVFGVADLVVFSGLDTLSSLRLLEIESLDEFDPAIFTEVRNYYYEDVAILMPTDQRLDASDEDEKEKEKEEKL